MTAQTATRSLLDRLEEADVDFEVIPHEKAETALAEAVVLGVDAHQVAKTVVLSTPGGLAKAIVPAAYRIDLRKVRDRLGSNKVELATEEEIAKAYPDYELGAIPPLPAGEHERVLIDNGLLHASHVVFEAGTQEQSLRLHVEDLLRLCGGTTADLCAR
jgi:Ala-tRNA(Pro) deacylase